MVSVGSDMQLSHAKPQGLETTSICIWLTAHDLQRLPRLLYCTLPLLRGPQGWRQLYRVRCCQSPGDPITLFKSILYLFIYLTTSGLHCCMRDPSLWYVGSAASQHVGSKFPDQGSNLHPQHHKVDSQPMDYHRSPSVTLYKHFYLLFIKYFKIFIKIFTILFLKIKNFKFYLKV